MRVAVLMGGTSDERDVSLSSGAEVADALRAAGHEVVAVDTTHGLLSREEEARLLSGGVDAAPPGASDLARLDERHTVALTRDPSLHDIEVFFLALHGGSGEDGTLQALDGETGEPLWTYQLPAPRRGGIVISNGTLYTICGGTNSPPYAVYAFGL